jgi:hypothetical protein
MARHKDRPAKEAKFLELWLDSRDVIESYRKAFGDKKSIKSCASLEFNKPYMQEAVALVKSIADKKLDQLAAREEQALALEEIPVHPLEARQHRILHLARMARGEITITRQAVTKEGELIEYEERPTFKEMIAAARLLGQMYGDHTLKIEHKNVDEGTPMFVYPDNGLGPSGATDRQAEDMNMCNACNTIYPRTERHICSTKSLASDNEVVQSDD